MSSSSSLVRFLFYVPTGRGFYRAISSIALLCWRRDHSAGMASHPRIPVWPPASGFFFGPVEPTLRIGLEVVVEPMAAFVAGRRIDHTCDVTARSKNESCLTTDQILGTKCRLPRHNVILAGCEKINRRVNLGKIHRDPTLCGLAGILDIVLNIGIPRVPAVHRAGQADTVGIPIQQIESIRRCALEIAVDDVPPDQIVGAQRPERERQPRGSLTRIGSTFF